MPSTVRNKRITKAIDLAHGRGLEIGPLTSPVVTKDEGDIYYLDHLSVEDLKKKYEHEPVELDKIVQIDYVLHPEGLQKTVGNDRFDYVIASHVIEHIPDMVGWLHQIANILNDGGILSLVIPDKRFTFDINRRVSLPADIIGAHLDGYTRFSTRMMYDFASECMVEVETSDAWRDSQQFVDAPRRWDLNEVMRKCTRNIAGEYVDCHCHVFTPASFIVILRHLIEQNMLPYKVVSFLETQENEIEFYVGLQKVNPKTVSKATLLKSLPPLPVEFSWEQKRIRELESRLAEQTEETIIAKQEIEALKQSFSWRATKGIRKIKRRISKG